MNKQEILKKSRQENMNGDECQRKRRTDQDAFSAWGFLIMCGVIMVLKLIQRESINDVLAILWCGSATAVLYGAIREKTKLYIFLTVVAYALAVMFFCIFCMEIF